MGLHSYYNKKIESCKTLVSNSNYKLTFVTQLKINEVIVNYILYLRIGTGFEDLQFEVIVSIVLTV